MCAQKVKVLGPGDDLEMMEKSRLWPNWPVLPVKRRVAGERLPECGLLIDMSDYRYTVFVVNLFALRGMFGDMVLDNRVKRCQYGSYREVLADGWLVD